jgi:hypothetical protein
MTATLAEKVLGLLNPSLLRSRKRPARTPPSTFLFLPIHFSNSPEPRSSVVPTILRQEPKNFLQLAPKNIKPVTSDAATNMATKSMAGCSVTV